MAFAKDTVVFVGPTLRPADARALLDARYQPPARMGDIYRLMSARVGRIVIIDGVFHGVPSVWHREVIDAISEGIEVVGASSMGALRAAELHGYGMRGIGRVFEAYRDGVIDGDDEVALLHGDADAGFRAMSDPLVNLRATLAALVDHAVITAAEHDALVAWLKAQHYPQRSERRLLEAPLLQAWSTTRQDLFANAWQKHRRDVKDEDARAALNWCARTPIGAAPLAVPAPHRPERIMWRIGKVLRGVTSAPGGGMTGDALAASDDAAAPEFRAALIERAFLLGWARLRGVSCPADVVERATRTWRQTREAARDCEDDEFLAAAGLTARRAEQLLRERALVDWLLEQGGALFGLDDRAGNASAFVADWGAAHGIVMPPGQMLAEGPAHFGLAFHLDSAVVEELRLSGRAIGIANASATHA